MGKPKASKADMEASKTSPAKILPNKRKDKMATLANSPTTSIRPTKTLIGLTTIMVGSCQIFPGISSSACRLINLLKYFQKPKAATEKIWLATTPTMAKAKVVFKSAVPPRKNGIKIFSPCSEATWPIEPTPGKSPSQLFSKINTKKLKTKGKYFKVFWRESVTESNTPSSISATASTAF